MHGIRRYLPFFRSTMAADPEAAYLHGSCGKSNPKPSVPEMEAGRLPTQNLHATLAGRCRQADGSTRQRIRRYRCLSLPPAHSPERLIPSTADNHSRAATESVSCYLLGAQYVADQPGFTRRQWSAMIYRKTNSIRRLTDNHERDATMLNVSHLPSRTPAYIE